MLKLIATLVFITATCLWEFNPAGHMDEITYTVHTGDTVWHIAEKYIDCQVKPLNEFVFEINERNHLQGKYIRPGDKLIIPLWTRAKGEDGENGK
mgnify:FL=1